MTDNISFDRTTMRHKIYVGNYPSSFVEDDVLNLFQDFEGVELAGFFKNKSKCYSFLLAVNERQLIEIVANLNDIDVCGRNLIVRATDEKLQKRIQESISKYGDSQVHPKNTCEVNRSTSVNENNVNFGHSESKTLKQSASPQMVSSYNKNTYPEEFRMSASAGPSAVPKMYNNYKQSGVSTNSENRDYSSYSSKPNYSSPQSSYYPQNSEAHDYSSDSSKPNYSSPQSSYYPQNSEAHDYSLDASKPNYSSPQSSYYPQNSETHDYSSYSSKHSYSSPKSSYNPKNSVFQEREKNGSGYSQNFSESDEKRDLGINPQETFSRFSKSKTDTSGHYKTMNERFDSYKKNSMPKKADTSNASGSTEEYQTRRRNASESSLGTVHSQPGLEEYESLSYVSVINFPLYTPTGDLYALFADFNPIKIFIVCNIPRKDKTPTEAIVCFENEQEATDAILTLDNTVYQGRVLIVTDSVDMSLVSELLSFG